MARICFIIGCGVVAYAVWSSALNVYITDIYMVQPTDQSMALGQIVACGFGGLMLMMPVFSAVGYHTRHNGEIVEAVQQRGIIRFIPVIIAGLIVAYGIGIIPSYAMETITNNINVALGH